MSKFNNTIIFFPGFLKTSDDFDVTEQGKRINITKCTANMANIYIVSFTLNDYCKPIDDICIYVMDQIRTIFKLKRILLVAHSFGSFYALRFAELYENSVKGILLIDPTCKNERYLLSLKSKLDEYKKIINLNDSDKVNIHQILQYKQIIEFKIDNFSSYPDKITNHNIYITIVLNNDNSIYFIEKERYFNKFIKNDINHSKYSYKIVTYDNLSHMIHYKRPHDIIKEIKLLLKLFHE